MLPIKPKKYNDGRTKQSFKDSADINKILRKAQKAGTLSHLQKFEGVYGDFSDFDYQEAQIMLARGKSIFDELPSEVRNEFGNNPASFFQYVNDPANKDELAKKLPALAAPGRQLIRLFGEPEEPKAPTLPAEPAGVEPAAAPAAAESPSGSPQPDG